MVVRVVNSSHIIIMSYYDLTRSIFKGMAFSMGDFPCAVAFVLFHCSKL